MRQAVISTFLIFVLLSLAACHTAIKADPKWQKVVFSSRWGPCRPNASCYIDREVERATQTLRRTGAGGSFTRKLEAQEWSRLEKLVTEARQYAPNCSEFVYDAADYLMIVYDDGSDFSKLVTHCVGGQGANPVNELAKLLSK
ncbi:MAG TPA: hypothetical protein VMH83_00795 [Candidatus Acidoferrum sp.]|nr:hypothetical protein [Candidatus Acidoferrum sp.]